MSTSRSSSPVQVSLSSFNEVEKSQLESLRAQIEEAQNQLRSLKSDVVVAKYEKNIKERWVRGQIKCSNTRHFVQVPYVRDGPKDQIGCRMRDFGWIFDQMAPYTLAACQCEREALAWKAARQYPGITTDQWVGQGCQQKGIGKYEAGVPQRRVWPVKYSLNKEQLEYMKGLFPGWHIECTRASSTHDHPCSHTTTAIHTNGTFENVIPHKLADGTAARILDVNGNPSSNERFMKYHPEVTVDTACKVIKPRDEFRRATKWGPEVIDGRRRWHNLYDREIGAEGATITPAMMSAYTAVVMIHVMYYYSFPELYRLLNRGNKDLILYGLVHRFEGETGSFNNGEQEWRADTRQGRRWITQHNKLAPGVKYEHWDNEILFKETTWQHGNMGLTWDTTLLGGNSYLIRMKVFDVSIENLPTEHRMCSTCGTVGAFVVEAGSENDNSPHPADPIPRFAPNTTDYVKAYNSTCLKVGDKYVEYALPPKTHTLLQEARRKMQTLPRTAETFKSHCSLLETKIKRYEADHKVSFTFEEADALKRASFWMDCTDSLNRDVALFATHWADSRKGDALYKFGHHAQERYALGVALDAYIASGVGGKALPAIALLAKQVLTNKS